MTTVKFKNFKIFMDLYKIQHQRNFRVAEYHFKKKKILNR